MALPAATPCTIPVVEPIVAIPVALLAQVPPVVELVKVLDPPIQVLSVPVIAFTVGIAVTVELGIKMVKSELALEDAMLSVPVYVPAEAVALNLTLTVVVTVPVEACVIGTELE